MNGRFDIRDATGRFLGWRQESGGRIELRDASGTLKGWYDPSANQTRGCDGTLIGYGDLLGGPLPSSG